MEDYLKFGAISRRPDEKVRVGSEDSGGSARVRRSCCQSRRQGFGREQGRRDETFFNASKNPSD